MDFLALKYSHLRLTGTEQKLLRGASAACSRHCVRAAMLLPGIPLSPSSVNPKLILTIQTRCIFCFAEGDLAKKQLIRYFCYGCCRTGKTWSGSSARCFGSLGVDPAWLVRELVSSQPFVAAHGALSGHTLQDAWNSAVALAIQDRRQVALQQQNFGL